MLTAFGFLDRPTGRTLQPSGDWTVLLIGSAVLRLRTEARRAGLADQLDLSQLGRVDTSGAFVLLRAVKPSVTVAPYHSDFDRLARLVQAAAQGQPAAAAGRRSRGLFERIGEAVVFAGSEINAAMAFAGELVSAMGRTLRHPTRMRLTPLFAIMEQTGINAIPIVMMMTFFIGAVIALVGANLLGELGVGVYTVELVGAAILREFGVVVAAILLAGRTTSAFAAELGSMRMNQETDALQVMGVDQFDALVVPRVGACLLMMPVMTFCADMGGLLGGISVSWAMMGINPTFFAQRMLETVNLTQFWLGMIKAPFMAVIIAASGCRKGLSVGGDVTSLGRAVTSAVVQSIFLLIMFDAVFAVIFMELDV